MKIKKIKKRSQRKDTDLYDINNFVVQNNTNKINEKKNLFEIPIPVYQEIQENFWEEENPLEEKHLDLNSDFLNNVIFFILKGFLFYFILF